MSTDTSTVIARLVIAALLLLASTVVAEPQLTYRIGNSLTWDSQPQAIVQLAAQRKIAHAQAYHINCGNSLQRIWSHPDEVCVDTVKPYGPYRRALPNHDWGAVTFQPYPGEGATLASDTDRIVDFIHLTQSKRRNTKTVFYIYAAWPNQQHGDYRDAWTQPTPSEPSTPTTLTRAYFDHLIQAVRARTDADVRLIPVGHVIFELDRLARAGELPGYKHAHDLYRDRYHLNHVGHFVAGVTTFATIFQQNPNGLICPPKQYGGGKDFNEPLYDAIHRTTWKVITEQNDLTGVHADPQRPTAPPE